MKEEDIRPRELFDRYLALAKRDAERLAASRHEFVAVPCPACASTDAAPEFVKDGFPYATCRACGSLFASPRPTAGAIAAFYAEAESVRFWGTHFYRETADARRERMFRPRAVLAAELADRYGLPPAAALADVGSGFGIFLEEAQATGRFGEVVGVEPAPELGEISAGRGFRVVPRAVEDVAEGEVGASLATCFEVLEHVHDPALFLGGVVRALKPGGLLLLTTLTASGFDIQVLWERSKSVHPPHHLNLMSVEGLRRLCDRAGLDVLELETPGQLDVDIVRGMLEEDSTIELPRFVRTLLDSGEAARDRFQRFLQESRLSSHIRVVARRR